MAKLIMLRGNSGSGKTTVAKILQKKLGHGTMLISQDVVRREILYVKDGKKKNINDLLFKLAMFGKENCEIVILEGILNSKYYSSLFEKILSEFKNNIYAFYFNIPFEETLKRHKTRQSSKEFGETEMKKWWKDKDLIKTIPETLICKELSAEEIVNMIYQKIKREEAKKYESR